MQRTFRHVNAVFCVVAMLCSQWFHCAHASDAGMSSVLKHEIELHGNASGGVLVLGTWSRPDHVSIPTTRGESAEAVLLRLAAKINETDPFHWWGDRTKIEWTSESGVKASGNRLSGLGQGLILAGTETGLGIPKPPLFLSGAYDAEQNQVFLKWFNPLQDYDRITCSGTGLLPNSTGCTLSLGEDPLEKRRFHVILWRGKTPSCAGIIDVTRDGQEDVADIPFYNGIMPNWAAWSTSTDLSGVEFEQGVKTKIISGLSQRSQSHADKAFSQAIRCKGLNVEAGIYRRFLNLKAGHTYRISAELSTLEMDADTNGWSFSLHAAYDGSDGKELSVRQFVGTEPLPDGRLGRRAAEIASYGPGSTTQGRWIKHSTAELSSGFGVKHITVPQNSNSITVWVRHTGFNSSGVAVGQVRIEDVTREE